MHPSFLAVFSSEPVRGSSAGPVPASANSVLRAPCVPLLVVSSSLFADANSLALFRENRDACSRRFAQSVPRITRIILHRSMTRPRSSLLCILFALLVVANRALADDIQKISPAGYVTDLAGVIPPSTQQRLEALCSELEQKTGAQLAIVTVRSLDDRPVEDYAVDLFKHLGVGAKKEGSGILLLLAPGDRKYRIEVGYGIEPIINDARAGDAGRAMVPFLRQNDFGSAVEVAAWQLAKYVADDRGVALSGQPPARPAANTRQQRESPISFFWIFFVLFILFQIFRSSVAGSTRRRGSGMNGCWWILPFLAGGGGGRGWGGGGSSWGGGGFGGGSSGGGGFGGFGGGSSGGGGASGSW